MSYGYYVIGIIGAGFAGLFSAWNLTERQISCTVVGKIESSASFAAQGVVGNKGLFLAESDLFEQKIHGSRLIADFCRKLQDISKTKILIEGSVFEAFDSIDEWQRVQKRVYRGEFYGCYGAKLLQANELSHELGFLQAPAVTLQYGFDSFVDVEVLLTTMKDILSQRGVRFIDEHVARISWDGKWSFQSEKEPLFESEHLLLAPGSGITFLRDVLDLDIPPAKLMSGFSFSYYEDQEVQKEFALLHEVRSFCQFSNRRSVGSTGRKGPLLAEDAAADFVEMQNIFGNRVDLQRMKKKLVAKGGERVFYKSMEPLWGYFESRRFSQPVYVLSGLHKNGLQLAPILSEKLTNAMTERLPI